MLKQFTFKLAVPLILLSSVAAHAVIPDYCKREGGYEFALTQSNVNALIATVCSALSHTEVERRAMVRDMGATLVHVWETSGNAREMTVSGYCAVTLTDLRKGLADKNRIQLTMRDLSEPQQGINLKLEGMVAGRPLKVDLLHNAYLTQRCSTGEARLNRVQTINAGWFTGEILNDIRGMLRTQRTGAVLTSQEHESWVSPGSSGGTNFQGLGLYFDLAQPMSGRRLGLAIAEGSAPGEVIVRTANVLEKADNSGYFDMRRDGYGYVSGFQFENFRYSAAEQHQKPYPNNHEFQAEAAPGGSRMVGCTFLNYESELALGESVDFNRCRREMEKSPILSPMLQNRIRFDNVVKSQKALAQAGAMIDKGLLFEYLRTTYGETKNYSDDARGYVVLERSVRFNDGSRQIIVTEKRSYDGGAPRTQTYSIGYATFGK